MAHHFDTGFSVREVPWHGLGLILDDYPGSWAEAQRLAGLDWEPVKEGVYEVKELYPDGTAQVEAIPGYEQVKRSDTGTRLDICHDTYELISHEVMGEIFEAIMEAADGEIRYETAGSLHEGKKVWALARLGGQREIPGDPSPMQAYMALLNSHDGTAALKVVATDVRIVCANTWHAADVDSAARGSAYSFKHTKNWRNRVEDAKRALAASHAQIEHTVALARELLQVKVNSMQRKTFIEQFAIHRVISNTVGKQAFGRKDLQARLEQPRVQTALQSTMADLDVILGSRTCDGIRDTAWGLLQAAGEFTDHHRDTKSKETYFTRTVIDKEPLKLAATRLVHDVVTAA